MDGRRARAHLTPKDTQLDSQLSDESASHDIGIASGATRAERECVTLAAREDVDPLAIAYLNRLSDALFVWSRWASARLGVDEVLWQPNAAAAAKREPTSGS